MSNIKWPLIWKNIKLDILNKQLILLELANRFGFKHIILKKAQRRVVTLLSFRLWATKIVCARAILDKIQTFKGFSIKEKIKIVKSLENVLIYSSAIKTSIQLFKINRNIVQYLFELILSPFLKCWGKNSLKRLLTKLKTKWITYQQIKNFYAISYGVISINKIIFYESVLNMFLILDSHGQFLKKWFMFYNLYKFRLNKFSNISILFLFFKFIFNKFESFIWKKLLTFTIKSSVIVTQIFFGNHYLQIKNLLLKLGYPTFLKVDFLSFFNSFNIICNNSFFMHNFILAEISIFFKLKGIHLMLRKSKICVSKTYVFIFFWWIIKWDKNKNQLTLKLRKNNFFSLKKKLKQFFFRNFSLCSYKLVVILNCILKHLYNIFKLNSFCNVYKYLDNYLFQLCWKWVLRKHNKWTSEMILKFYFKYKNKFNGLGYFKSENAKLKKKSVYIIRFKSLILLH